MLIMLGLLLSDLDFHGGYIIFKLFTVTLRAKNALKA